MGQLDKTCIPMHNFAQDQRMPPTMWQHLLGPAHDMRFLPYELAEIEEYSLEIDDAKEAQKLLQVTSMYADYRFSVRI